MSNNKRNRESRNGAVNEKWKDSIFEERRALVGKWFEKWTDEQRKTVLTDLVNQCKVKQLEYTGELISTKRPLMKDDFTRCLPRVISLYIFSFLDPRSLCRASQACWYWKHLVEVDQIWMPKCARLGWLLPFTPSPFEVGAWKRLYIENIITLKCMVPKQPEGLSLRDLSKLTVVDGQSRPQTGRSLVGKSTDRPPWKGSDPTPKDTWRNNYLDNDDEVEKVNKLRKKHSYGPVAEEIMRKAKNKVQSGQNKTSLTRELLSRSRSGPDGLDGWGQYNYTGERPAWAKNGAQQSSVIMGNNPGAPFADASIRPPPVQTYPLSQKERGTVQLSKTSPATLVSTRNRSPTRSARDPPTTDLFPTSKGWHLPDKDDDSDN